MSVQLEGGVVRYCSDVRETLAASSRVITSVIAVFAPTFRAIAAYRETSTEEKDPPFMS